VTGYSASNSRSPSTQVCHETLCLGCGIRYIPHARSRRHSQCKVPIVELKNMSNLGGPYS
jgi:hypothetical protein